MSERNSMNNSQRARKAIRKNFDQSYIDNNLITPEEVKEQWGFLGVIGIPPFKLAQIINKNEVVILDYKTGKSEKKHYNQLEGYSNLIKELGYKISKKILVN